MLRHLGSPKKQESPSIPSCPSYSELAAGHQGSVPRRYLSNWLTLHPSHPRRSKCWKKLKCRNEVLWVPPLCFCTKFQRTRCLFNWTNSSVIWGRAAWRRQGHRNSEHSPQSAFACSKLETQSKYVHAKLLQLHLTLCNPMYLDPLSMGFSR